MNRRFKLLVLCLCLLAFPIAAFSQWQPNGNPIVTVPNTQEYQVICTDNAGGAVIAWDDANDIHAQRINGSGSILWTVNGVAVTNGPSGPKSIAAICPDGGSGAFIAWQDYRGGLLSDIYVQHINASGVPQWTANGVPVCTDAADQIDPHIVQDLNGGAIIGWEDQRSGNYKIYAQRVNSSGVVQWTANGVQLCGAAGDQVFGTSLTTLGAGSAFIADGAGGAIAAWSDSRNGSSNLDVFAQRISGAGAMLWLAAGVTVCTATGNQYFPVLASDASAGAIVVWLDHRNPAYVVAAQRIGSTGSALWTADGMIVGVNAYSGTRPAIIPDGFAGAIIVYNDNHQTASSDIFAQRINASGATQWLGAGETVCTATGDQTNPALVSTGSQGALVTWEDLRNGSDRDIYAQKLNAPGSPQWGPDGMPLCTASGEQYAPVITTDGSAGAIVAWGDARNCCGGDIYALRTTGPNTPAGLNVSVPLGNATVTFDNVYSPGTTSLTVNPSCSGIPNFSIVSSTCYDITSNVGYTGNIKVCFHYDDTSLPGPESGLKLLHYDSSLSQWVDVTTSLDTSGNIICGNTTTLSPFAVGSGTTTGVNPDGAPGRFALNQNVPNPFNPMTVITYDVPAGGARVSIGIYDASGKLVRTLLDESKPAGRFAVEWDGRDAKGEAVASGVYFYRMAARDFVETKKMVLLK